MEGGRERERERERGEKEIKRLLHCLDNKNVAQSKRGEGGGRGDISANQLGSSGVL